LADRFVGDILRVVFDSVTGSIRIVAESAGASSARFPNDIARAVFDSSQSAIRVSTGSGEGFGTSACLMSGYLENDEPVASEWTPIPWKELSKVDVVHTDGGAIVGLSEEGYYMVHVDLVADFAAADEIHSVKLERIVG